MKEIMSRNESLKYLPKAVRRPGREKRLSSGDELQTLQEIGQIILTSSDIKFVLAEILDRVLREGSFDLGVIGLMRRDSEGIEPIVHQGFHNPKQIHACFPRVHRLTPRTGPERSSTTQAVVEENISRAVGKGWMKREGVRSFIEVSILAENKLMGAIQLGSRTLRKFPDREVRFLKALGCQIGLAVQKARRAIDAQRTTEVQGLLKEINQEIAVLDTHSLLEQLEDKARKIFEVDGVQVRTFREQKSVALKEARPPEAEGRSFSRRSQWIREHRKPLMIPDLTREPSAFGKTREADAGMRAYLGVPIFSKTAEVIGILRVLSKRARRFRPAEIDQLQQLADGIAAVFENARLLEEARQRVQEQAALNAIATAAGQSLHLSEILELSLDKVLQVTGRERGYIRLKDPTSGELVLAAHRGISKEYAETLLYRRTLGGKSDQVFETGRSLVINDPQGTTLKKETLDEGIRSIAWVPMKAAGKVVGILNISTAQSKPFEPREVELLEAIASVIGNAVENSRLFLETLARSKEISALYDISTTVNRSLDLDQVLQEVLQKIMDIFHFDATRVYLFRPEAGEIHLRAALHTSSGPPPQMLLFRPGQGHIGKVFKTNEPIIFSDVRQDTECEANSLSRLLQESGFNFFAAFPIRTKLEPVGVLSCIGRSARRLTSAEIRLLTSMTDQIGITVEHVRLYEETKKQAEALEKTNTELRKRENVQSLLKELSQDITSLDIEQLLKKLTEKARDFFGADVCSVRVKDREGWRLIGVSGTKPENLMGGLHDGQTRGRTLWIIENRKPLVIPDMANDTRVPSTGTGALASFRSYAGIPLLSRTGEVIGVLRLLSYHTKNFSSEEVELLQQLANGAAIALENAWLLEEIKRQSLELERSNKVKDEFLGVVSHELRTPLSAVMGYAALMQDGVLGEVHLEQAKALRVIENQTKDLLNMINSILEATKIEARATIVQNQDTDLNAFLDEIRLTYDISLKKDVTLVWDYHGDLPRIATDPAKLKYILQNLINNAIKFTHQGHVILSARYLPRLQKVEFRVTDTGVGIPPEMQPAIFERFRQADSSDTRPYGGVGLGLYIAKSFTEMLGGTLAVASEVEKGSTFTVNLRCENSISAVGDLTPPTPGHTEEPLG